MTMTGDINGVPWYRCAEATRLYMDWEALAKRADMNTFADWFDYVEACEAAWKTYTTHLWSCGECKKARRNGE